MAALKVLYNKVHQVIATDLTQSMPIYLSWKLLFLPSMFLPCDVWLSCALSMFSEYPVCMYIMHELSDV